MKKLLMSFILMVLLVPANVMAADYSDLSGFYFTPKLSLGSAGGFTFGGSVAVGVDLKPVADLPLRAEVEGGILYSSDTYANVETSYLRVPVLASVYYDFHFKNKLNFVPYAGLGLGLSYSSVESTWSNTSNSSSGFDFGFAATVGTSVPVSKHVLLDVAYRFGSYGVSAHQLLIGARFAF